MLSTILFFAPFLGSATAACTAQQRINYSNMVPYAYSQPDLVSTYNAFNAIPFGVPDHNGSCGTIMYVFPINHEFETYRALNSYPNGMKWCYSSFPSVLLITDSIRRRPSTCCCYGCRSMIPKARSQLSCLRYLLIFCPSLCRW